MTPEREAELREAHRLMPSPLSTELFAEIDRLRAELGALKAADNPEFDATDGAHPAWWRAHDYVSARFKEELDKSRRERDEAHLERRNAEERGAFWCLKAGARVIYSTVGNDAYWLLAKEVCDKARKERGE